MLTRLKLYLPKEKNQRAIVITGALLLLGAFLLAFASHVTRNLSGEAFYDFQYAYRLPLLASWKEFFFDRIRSRLLHGVFISSVYHLVGYNPRALYLSVYIVYVATAVLIAMVLRDFVKRPWLAGLLTATFALLPVALPDLIELKKAHHVLAWLAFWLAVFLFKKWVIDGKRYLLLAGVLAFLASVFTYEATVALLPVAMLLSLPYIKDFKDLLRKLGLAFFITLCAALAFLRLEDLKEFSSIGQTYPGFSDPSATFTKVFVAGPQLASAIWQGGIYGNALPSGWPLALGQALLAPCLLAATFGVYTVIRQKVPKSRRKANLFAIFHDPVIALCLAAVYLTVVTYLPFMLAGQAPDTDSLRGAGIGLVLLAVAAFIAFSRLRKDRVAEIFTMFVCSALMLTWLFGYANQDRAVATSDTYLNNFIYTLRQQVPGVTEGSNFIFINSGVGRTGCIGLMNMLYSRSALHCIHLFDNDKEEVYIRETGGLREVGGQLFTKNFIIITIAPDGQAILLDQISPADFPLVPITWLSSQAIFADPAAILPSSSPSALYDYILPQVAR
jgi:hypothetical protein